MKKMIIFAVTVFFIGACAYAHRLYTVGKQSQAMDPPAVVGLECPDKPNCVSSLAKEGDTHRIDPLTDFGGDEPLAKIRTVLADMNIVISGDDPRFVHGEATSKIFEFVDDVDIMVAEDEQAAFHIRSASRVGYADMGVNLKRVEEIRRRLAIKSDGKVRDPGNTD